MTEEQALRHYAEMINTLNADCLLPHLADDFCYESQWVLSALNGKQAYIDYIYPKLKTLGDSDKEYSVEMARLESAPSDYCAIVYEDKVGVATILAKVQGQYISRLDMCAVPTVDEAAGTGEFPGL